MSKHDSLALDLLATVLVEEITIPELRAVVGEIEKNIGEMRKRTSDIRVRRKLDAVLGLGPWPEKR